MADPPSEPPGSDGEVPTAGVDPRREPIKLDQFLKLHGLVESGGQAKVHIKSGEVLVNGEVETRRGRRLRPGDTVEVFGQKLRVASVEE